MAGKDGLLMFQILLVMFQFCFYFVRFIVLPCIVDSIGKFDWLCFFGTEINSVGNPETSAFQVCKGQSNFLGGSAGNFIDLGWEEFCFAVDVEPVQYVFFFMEDADFWV